MKIERMKMADLTPAEKNTRIHGSAQLNELVRSFRMFGQIRPIVVDENNVIYCGNGFYAALQQIGETEIDVLRVVGLTDDKKKKLMLADNQIFQLGRTNANVMDELLASLEDFDVPGYDPEMLEQLYGEIEEGSESMKRYGVIDDETAQELASVAAERQEVHNTQVYTNDNVKHEKNHIDEVTPPTIKFVDGMMNIPKNEAERPYIVCPRCGEKIWV